MSDVLLRGEGGPLEGELWENWAAILSRRQRAVYRQLVNLRDDNVSEVSWSQLCRAIDMKVGLYMTVLGELEAHGLIAMSDDE